LGWMVACGGGLGGLLGCWWWLVSFGDAGLRPHVAAGAASAPAAAAVASPLRLPFHLPHRGRAGTGIGFGVAIGGRLWLRTGGDARHVHGDRQLAGSHPRATQAKHVSGNCKRAATVHMTPPLNADLTFEVGETSRTTCNKTFLQCGPDAADNEVVGWAAGPGAQRRPRCAGAPPGTRKRQAWAVAVFGDTCN
jgi:hypothetical protein